MLPNQNDKDKSVRPMLHAGTPTRLSFLETVFLPFVEQVSFRTSQVHNLRTAISVLLLLSALFAVIRVRDTETPTNNAPALI